MVAAMAEDDGLPTIDQLKGEVQVAAGLGDWLRCREVLLKAIDLDPNSCELHATNGYYTFMAGAQGLQEHERLSDHHLAVAREIDPRSPLPYYWAGRVFMARGNAPRARAEFATALEKQPGYGPAVQALTELDGGKPPVAAAAQTMQAARARVSAAGRNAVLVGLLVVSVAGGAFYHLRSDPEGFKKLAEELGTNLTITSASRNPPNLMIELGDAWHQLGEGEKENELRTIGPRAAIMGFEKVLIFSSGRHVAEASKDEVCPGGPCMLQPMPVVTGSGPPGAETVELKVPPDSGR